MRDVYLFALGGVISIALSLLAIVYLGGGAYMLALFAMALGVVLVGIAYDRRTVYIEESASKG